MQAKKTRSSEAAAGRKDRSADESLRIAHLAIKQVERGDAPDKTAKLREAANNAAAAGMQYQRIILKGLDDGVPPEVTAMRYLKLADSYSIVGNIKGAEKSRLISAEYYIDAAKNAEKAGNYSAAANHFARAGRLMKTKAPSKAGEQYAHASSLIGKSMDAKHTSEDIRIQVRMYADKAAEAFNIAAQGGVGDLIRTAPTA